MQSEKRPVRIEEFKAYIYRLSRGQFHPKDCSLYFVVDQLFSGVDLPVDQLGDLHSRHVTLVFGHQFWDVAVAGTGFYVTLNFFRKPYKCFVPWDSIVHCYTVGRELPTAELTPVPTNDPEPKVVRVDFQTKRRL